MRKKIAIALTAGVAAATMGFGATGTASAAPSAKGACVQAGIGTLKSLELLQVAAQNKGNPTIDYSALVAVPEGSFLSLGQVVKAHTTNPELFPWCSAG